MIIENARLSYLNCFEPGETPSGDMKYSACIMIDRDDKATLKAIDAAVDEAMNKGVTKGKFAKSKVKSAHRPMRDGSAEFKDGERGEEFNGVMFFNASNKSRPGVVDKFLRQIIDPDDAYSGCYANVDINFYPFAVKTNHGVAASLNNIMITKQGDRLDGRQSADKAFEGMAVPEDEETDDSMT